MPVVAVERWVQDIEAKVVDIQECESSVVAVVGEAVLLEDSSATDEEGIQMLEFQGFVVVLEVSSFASDIGFGNHEAKSKLL